MKSQSLSRIYWGFLLASGSWFTLSAIVLFVPGVKADPLSESKQPNPPKSSAWQGKAVPSNNAASGPCQDSGMPEATPPPTLTSSPSVPPNNPPEDVSVILKPNAIATTCFNQETPPTLGLYSKRDPEQLASHLEAPQPLDNSPEHQGITPLLSDVPQDTVSPPNPPNATPASPGLFPSPNNEPSAPEKPQSEPANSECLENPSPSASDTNSPESSSTAKFSLTPLQLLPTELINLETANVLSAGSVLINIGGHIFPRDQVGKGTGLQTYSVSVEGGITDQFQIGLDWVLFDDTLGQSFSEGIPNLGLLDFASTFKYQFLKNTNYSIAVAGSLEIGKFTGSYGLYTPNNLQQSTTTIGGTLKIPFTYNISPILQWHLVPGVVFWPNTINNGGNFYGTSLNLGTGFDFALLKRLTLFGDINVPLSGGNAVNNQGQIFQKTVWAAGLTYLQSPTVSVDIYATNALGSTPATETLAFIPGGNQVALGFNLRYTPDLGQNYPTSFRETTSPLSTRDSQLLFNGITITSPETLKSGMASFQGGIGPDLNFQLSYGMSDDFQFALVGQELGDNTVSVGDDVKLGAFSKLRILSQSNGDPFSFSLVGGLEEGTSRTAVGLFTTELAFMYQVTPQFALMFNPKAGFFGHHSVIGTGFGLNYELFRGIQLIGEVTPILTGPVQNAVWAGGLRYFNPNWNAGLDIYVTNGIGTYGIGGLIGQSNNQVSVGFNLLWLLGVNSNQSKPPVSEQSNLVRSKACP